MGLGKSCNEGTEILYPSLASSKRMSSTQTAEGMNVARSTWHFTKCRKTSVSIMRHQAETQYRAVIMAMLACF